jgi:glycine/D-amino acid oxidase-like deaminating enzyme
MGAKVFPVLTEETGQEVGFKLCGSLSLSRTNDRTTLLKRNAARASAFGIDAKVIGMDETLEKYPLLDKSKFQCALWLPNDGSASPTDVCMAFSMGAKKYGYICCLHQCSMLLS